MIEEVFNNALSRLAKRPARIACAVSGGGDSMALALLSNAWAKKNKIHLVALTVDHGLRKEAREEARKVAGWMKKKKIEHHILTNKASAKSKSDVMNYARQVRYGLIEEWCRKNKVKYLLVAHNLEDQAETFLLRLERGSGVDGLSAIPEKNELGRLVLLRPLLAVTRQELRDYLKKNRQPWIEDPTNENTKYKRNKVRQALSAISDNELLMKRIANTAISMQRVRDLLETETKKGREKCVKAEKGRVILDLAQYRNLHDEIALRLLAQLLMQVGKKQYKPRFEKLKNLHHNMTGKGFAGATLWGCKLAPSRKKQEKDKLIITAE